MTRSLSITVLAISLAATAPAQIEQGWLRHYSDPALPNASNWMSACAVAADGSIYATSSAAVGPLFATTIHKYAPDGTLVWNVQPAQPDTYYHQVLIDAAGDVYFFGRRFGGGGNASDFVTTKLDSSGAVLWAEDIQLQSGATDYAFAVIDAANNYVFAATMQEHDIVFARSYAPNGTLNYHSQTTQSYWPYLVAAVARPGGGIVCCGRAFPYSPQGPLRQFTVAFSATGALAWSRTSARNVVHSIAADPSGRVALAGSHWTGTGSQGRVEMLDGNGNTLWVDQFVIAPWREAGIQGVAFAMDGSLWAVGGVSSQDDSRALALRYDSAGERTLTHLGGNTGFSGVLPGEAGQAWVLSLDWAAPSVLRMVLSQLDAGGNTNWRYVFNHDSWYGVVPAPRSRFIAFGESRYTPSGVSNAQLMQLDARDSPAGHCTAQVNSLGCSASLAFVGSASVSSPSGFEVLVDNLRNGSAAMFLYGVSGAASTPFHGATLCIAAPLRRTPMLDTGGSMLPVSDCSGTASLDFNAFASGALGLAPDPALAVAGTVVETQLWSRDSGAPQTTNLSSALRFTMLE